MEVHDDTRRVRFDGGMKNRCVDQKRLEMKRKQKMNRGNQHKIGRIFD